MPPRAQSFYIRRLIVCVEHLLSMMLIAPLEALKWAAFLSLLEFKLTSDRARNTVCSESNRVAAGVDTVQWIQEFLSDWLVD